MKNVKNNFRFCFASLSLFPLLCWGQHQFGIQPIPGLPVQEKQFCENFQVVQENHDLVIESLGKLFESRGRLNAAIELKKLSKDECADTLLLPAAKQGASASLEEATMLKTLNDLNEAIAEGTKVSAAYSKARSCVSAALYQKAIADLASNPYFKPSLLSQIGEGSGWVEKGSAKREADVRYRTHANALANKNIDTSYNHVAGASKMATDFLKSYKDLLAAIKAD